ncbi:hypothetical protein K469DRAFT_721216 [Zopfia rhizophila CBS 207.26]|uniref:Uncharacterized protein n=1 Tax=Zopfia rhizophila CBS 207.26 TaxID=1314779 RepID=A0A6A6EJQ0_9PEZI|nr:hypothetical protein K469DRAFT_721216 [Zopfia rhizophila CBS 207.26]
MSDHDAFLEIDKNIFVVSVYLDAPVTQIITDITQADGGPAGYLGGKVVDDGMQ